MAQIKLAVLSGARFQVGKEADYIFQVIDKNGELTLYINDMPMEAIVSLSYKNLEIRIMYAGLMMTTEVRLKDLVFIPHPAV